MKFSATIACLTAYLASAAALSIFDGRAPESVTSDGDKVPGESPLIHCASDHSADLLIIKRVDLNPNPPQAGKQLVITATGTLKEKIDQGAYVKLVVKYGLIRLVSTTADLCEQIGNVDLKCPIEAGDLTMTKTVDLPKEVPPGTYTVTADVYTADDKKITCLTAIVTFPMHPGFISNDL